MEIYISIHSKGGIDGQNNGFAWTETRTCPCPQTYGLPQSPRMGRLPSTPKIYPSDLNLLLGYIICPHPSIIPSTLLHSLFPSAISNNDNHQHSLFLLLSSTTREHLWHYSNVAKLTFDHPQWESKKLNRCVIPRDENMHVEVLEPNLKANINLYASRCFIGIFFGFLDLEKHSLRWWVVVKMVENTISGLLE